MADMREMKDSGTSFIGAVPSSWQTDKVKYHLERYEAKNPGDQQILSVYREYGVIPKDSRDDNHNVTSEDTTKYKYVKHGYFVINKMKAWQGSMGVSEHEGVVSPAYFIYRFKDNLFDKKYFHYLLRGCYKDEFRRLSGGIREGQWDLPSLAFENTIVLIPDKLEQQVIVAFLDSKCAEIDALSADIQSEIDTLEAYKRSVITETVTKGLNPNAHMKDSGTGWMGDVPESWNKTRVKYCLKEVNERSIAGEEEPLSMSQKMGLVPTTMINVPHIMATYVGAKIARPNDLVLNKLKAHLGVFSVSQYTGLVSPDYAVYQAYDNTNPKYLEYLFKTDACINEFKKYITGVGQGLSRLYTKDLFRIAIAIPSCDEQDCIVDYLNRKSAEIDAIVKQKQEQLALLADYKKSLIYEYVTGKKEIPDKDI